MTFSSSFIKVRCGWKRRRRLHLTLLHTHDDAPRRLLLSKKDRQKESEDGHKRKEELSSREKCVCLPIPFFFVGIGEEERGKQHNSSMYADVSTQRKILPSLTAQTYLWLQINVCPLSPSAPARRQGLFRIISWEIRGLGHLRWNRVVAWRPITKAVDVRRLSFGMNALVKRTLRSVFSSWSFKSNSAPFPLNFFALTSRNVVCYKGNTISSTSVQSRPSLEGGSHLIYTHTIPAFLAITKTTTTTKERHAR